MEESTVLVLTRKLKQELVIGGHIRVIVLSVSGNRVQLGIEAPEEVAVDRAENCENRRAHRMERRE